MTKRKSPIKHRVKTHVREGKRVQPFIRGKGNSKRIKTKKIVRKIHTYNAIARLSYDTGFARKDVVEKLQWIEENFPDTYPENRQYLRTLPREEEELVDAIISSEQVEAPEDILGAIQDALRGYV